jgi:hypothetical protein
MLRKRHGRLTRAKDLSFFFRKLRCFAALSKGQGVRGVSAFNRGAEFERHKFCLLPAGDCRVMTGALERQLEFRGYALFDQI